MCLHLNGHCVIYLTGFYNGSVQSCRQTVLLYRGPAEIVRWLCNPRVFLGICVPNVYNYSFLIEIALQHVKQNTA